MRIKLTPEQVDAYYSPEQPVSPNKAEKREKQPTVKKPSSKTSKKRQLSLPGLGAVVPPAAAKGHENELQILIVIHLFGWLTARQIAALCWPNGKASMQSARTVLRRLKRSGEVVQRAFTDNNNAYVLGPAGVTRLHQEGYRLARRGTDLLRGDRASNRLHRWVANEYVLQRRLNGAQVWTEYQILARRGPFPSREYAWRDKIPDALIGKKLLDGLLELEWIEVELSRRKRNDLQKLASFIVESLYQPTILARYLALGSVNLIYPVDSHCIASCKDAYLRACALIKALKNTLPQVLENRSEFEAQRLTQRILKQVYITIFDIGNGPVLRKLDDKSVDLWSVIGMQTDYHMRLKGFFSNTDS